MRSSTCSCSAACPLMRCRPLLRCSTAIRDVWPEDTERLPTHELAGLVAGHESGEFDWPESQRTRN